MNQTTNTNAASPPHRLEIKLVGGISVFYLRTFLNLGKKQRAFLAYLALSNEGIVTRDRLAGMLWSDSSATKAKGNLRQLLKNTRDLLEDAGFQGLSALNSQEIRLDPSSVLVDTREMLEMTAKFDPPSCMLERKDIHETLFEGFEGLDPEFDSWIYIQRKTLLDRLVTRAGKTRLGTAIERNIRTSNLATALLALDASNEVAVRAKMFAYAKDSNIACALRTYSELVTRLDQEYGMGPTAETEALAVKIKMSEGLAVDSTLAASDIEPTTVNTVLPYLLIEPFGTELIPKEKVYIARGFRHDLLASLVQFRDWRVVEKTHGFDHDELVDIPNKRYSLKAETFLHNEVLHLIFTVLETTTGVFIWSQKHELNMESWFSTQKQIIRKLAVALNIHVSADRLAAISRNRELPAALHDRWLLGQRYLLHWNPQDGLKAETIYRTIINEVPEFAPAYSGLVQIEKFPAPYLPGYAPEADN